MNSVRVNEVLCARVALDDVIVEGEARGADLLAAEWAIKTGTNLIRVPANWARHGKGAGFRRNAVIASLPIAELIAFPGGNGTADMIKRARQKGISVYVIG